jgi:hypothetical protein
VHQPAIFRELFVLRRKGLKLTPAARELGQFIADELPRHGDGENIECVVSPAALDLLTN